MIAYGREEPIGDGSGSVRSCIGVDVVVIELTDIAVDGGGLPVRIIVVANSHDKIGIPAFDQVRYEKLIGCARTVIAHQANDDAACAC